MSGYFEWRSVIGLSGLISKDQVIKKSHFKNQKYPTSNFKTFE